MPPRIQTHKCTRTCRHVRTRTHTHTGTPSCLGKVTSTVMAQEGPARGPLPSPHKCSGLSSPSLLPPPLKGGAGHQSTDFTETHITLSITEVSPGQAEGRQCPAPLTGKGQPGAVSRGLLALLCPGGLFCPRLVPALGRQPSFIESRVQNPASLVSSHTPAPTLAISQLLRPVMLLRAPGPLHGHFDWLECSSLPTAALT